MAGRITIDNLSESLKEYLNGLGLTEAQVNQIVVDALVDINEKNVNQDEAITVAKAVADAAQTKTDVNLLTNDKTIVGAINELFQNANNGKELIANAIGEPVSADDTFSAMSDDINGLLSTFKTNMMNNGIAVESSDKFKQLIDKIATMVEEGSGKGIQFAEGDILDEMNMTEYGAYQSWKTYNVNYDIGFTPTIVFLYIDSFDTTHSKKCITCSDFSYNTETATKFGATSGFAYSFYINNITDKGFTINLYHNVMYSSYTYGWKYYAIGVGEEDTTLRDSLASILEEEGVSVTEEDDMASLITKVDSEFDRQVVPAGDAVASNVLSGKTFINSTGQTITGTMANMLTHTQVADYVAWNENSIYLGIPTGAYVNASATGYPEVYIEKTRLDSNLVPENIVSGKSICGVTGSAKSYTTTRTFSSTFYTYNNTGGLRNTITTIHTSTDTIPSTAKYTATIKFTDSFNKYEDVIIYVYRLSNNVETQLFQTSQTSNTTTSIVTLNEGDEIILKGILTDGNVVTSSVKFTFTLTGTVIYV